MIHFNQVSKSYSNGFQALNQVSFHLNSGEMAFLTGHSGAGKSTLLKLLCLLERPSEGQIIINDVDLTKVSKRKIPYLRRTIGMITQNPHLLLERSLFENVALPLIICGYQKQDIQRRVRTALDKVGLLRKEHFHAAALSDGEKQRVGIARAIVHKPAIILADEPTGNLDPALSADIMKLFLRFSEAGVSMLIASHDIQLIQQFNKRTLTLGQGQLIADSVKE